MQDYQPLLPEELFLFQHNGYLLFPQALDPAAITELRTTILHHAEARIAPLSAKTQTSPASP